jgi:hypothetical protein
VTSASVEKWGPRVSVSPFARYSTGQCEW